MVFLATTATSFAETCDAGHGCKITCKDGCSAIYNHDTGRCSKACGSKARELAEKYERPEAQKAEAKKDHLIVVVKGLKDDSLNRDDTVQPKK
jgi:hypothetical protein